MLGLTDVLCSRVWVFGFLGLGFFGKGFRVSGLKVVGFRVWGLRFGVQVRCLGWGPKP